MASVAELVNQYIPNQFIGQFHQSNIEANCPVGAATAPAAASVAKANALVSETMSAS